MDYDRFIVLVEEAAAVGPEEAKRATRATLETLAERISRGEASDLADRLPAQLAAWLHKSSPSAEPFDVDEFIRRVAAREEVDSDTAERHARAVFAVLGQAVGEDELVDMMAELPRDFDPLLPKGRRVAVLSAERFVRRVAQRAGLDEEGARRAVDAVLETLAERISGGEVEDLIEELPVPLHPPLRRGDQESHGAARRMSVDDFVRTVAEREGVTPDEARDHTRAVFATLREAVPEKEFFDMRDQLPDEYTPLLARP